jgi:hypothetical protein
MRDRHGREKSVGPPSGQAWVPRGQKTSVRNLQKLHPIAEAQSSWRRDLGMSENRPSNTKPR